MKKSLYLSAILMGSAIVAQAATISLADFSSGTNTQYVFSSSSNITSVTANQVTSWLSGKTDGWYATPANGNTGGQVFTVANPVSPQDNGSTTLQFTNRAAYKGAVVGLKITLDDYAAYSNLNFSVDFQAIGGGTDGFSINLVYQTSEGWQISTVSTSNAELSASTDKTKTVSANLSQTPLTDGAIYAVITSQTGGGTSNTLNVSLQGEKSVPEPATATLGLLGLAALMVRRRKA